MQTNGGSNNNDQSTTPSDFPVLNNTGNPTQDALNYDLAKKAWIKNNPGKYAAMNGSYLEQNNQAVELTKVEKEKWILENPTLYNPNILPLDGSNIIKDPNTKPNDLHVINKTEFGIMPLEKQQHILAHPELYKIVE
jgi:hypothetical protein